MTKERCVKILEDLICYIEENWEESCIKDYPEGLKYAIDTIKNF